MEKKKQKSNNKGQTILVGLCVLFLIFLRVPSIIEPHWYSDEGLYASIANSLNKGLLLYKDLWFTQSPGIISYYYFALFGGNISLLLIKIINLLFSIGTLILTYKVAEKLFNRKVGLISAIMLTLILGLPIIEANIASYEIVATFLLTSGIYLLLAEKNLDIFFGGIALGISIIFSTFMIFPVMFIVAYVIITRFNNRKKVTYYPYALLFLGIMIPIVVILWSLYSKGILSNWYEAAVRYPLLNQPYFEDLGFVIFKNSLLVRTILVILGLLGSYHLLRKKEINKVYFLLAGWTISLIYTILLTENDYTHYLIQIVPVFSIITTLILISLFKLKKVLQRIFLASLYVFSSFFLLGLFTHGRPINYYISTADYYVNFYRYLARRTDAGSYTLSFGEATYTSYRLTSFLSQNFPDVQDIYIWTDNPWIYYLLDTTPPVKYLTTTEAYQHWDITSENLQENNPTLVILDSNSKTSQEKLQAYLDEYDYVQTDIFENYVLYSKGELLSETNASQ